MEKVDGSSSHIKWKDGQLHFFSGGASNLMFVQLFDQEKLKAKFIELNTQDCTLYGEAYGGKVQKRSYMYGPDLHFVGFECQFGDIWLNVPAAEQMFKDFGLPFVPYEKVSTDLASLDAVRAKPSEQAFRNGMSKLEDPTTHHMREGVVLRPLIELRKNNGERIVAKYKNDAFSERKSKADTQIGDEAEIKILHDAEALAEEWVTPIRLIHVLDQVGNPEQENAIPVVMKAMYNDVFRESKQQPDMEAKETRRAISRKAVELYRQYLAGKRKVAMAEATGGK